MIDIKTLFFQILVLCLYIVPGVLMRKMKFSGGEKVLSPGFPKGLTNFVLYISQPCMMIAPYIRDFDVNVLKNMAVTLFLTLALHAILILIAFTFIRPKVKGNPNITERVMRLSIIFSNCGYMGIPLIETLLGPEAAVYATVYNIGFQIVSWSIGFYVSTGDKKYVSVKKMLINPSMISIYVGLLIFFLPINRYIPDFVITFINGMKGLVLPLSLCVVGYHFGGNKIKTIWEKRGKVLYSNLIRGIISPVIVFAFLFLFKISICKWLNIGSVPLVVAYICAATPSATLSSMLAEKFDLDRDLSGIIVPVSTILAIVTMPITALLIYLL